MIIKFDYNITDEELIEFEKESLEFLAKERWLDEMVYVYGTPTSHSLKLLNEAGHYPIGITTYACEETFIFKSKKSASKAWKSGVLGFDGWFYSDSDFNKQVKTDELFNNKIYWLYYEKEN